MIAVPSQVKLGPHRDHIIQVSSAALCKILLKHFNGYLFGDPTGDYTYENALKIKSGPPPILANPMVEQGAHVNKIHTETRVDQETGEKSWVTFSKAVLGLQKEVIYWTFFTNSSQATIQMIRESLQKKGILTKDLFITKYQTRSMRKQMGRICHAPKLWKGFPVMVAGICLPSTDDMPDLEKTLKRLLKKQGIS